ncbi:MAG TPA: aminotransferase, partial [Bifidobacterium sp.]|nr:aminotransferase [Bifidobacterium sp.]
MRFSSRVDISEPNPIAKAEAAAKAAGRTLGRLNDSNPTRHALAPAAVPAVYTADPRGQRYAREALAAFLDAQEIGHCTPDDL